MRREHSLQIAVAHMLELVLEPELTWWTAIDHAAQLSARYGADRKRRGVKRGLPDFLLLYREPLQAMANVMGLELKANKGRLSPEQKEVGGAWLAMGHGVYVARSLEDVQKILDHCRVPMRRRMTLFMGGADDRPRRPAPPRHQGARRRRKPKDNVPMVLSRAAQKN
jgi:hypothetical protein